MSGGKAQWRARCMCAVLHVFCRGGGEKIQA